MESVVFNRDRVSVPLFIALVIFCWLEEIRSHPRHSWNVSQRYDRHALTVSSLLQTLN